MHASQVIKKKGRHPNPPPFEAFTFKRHYVVTCAQTPDQVWTETVANLGPEIKKEFNDYDWSEAPNPELCAVASAAQRVYNMIVQGVFGNSTAEYIGAGGMGGLLCPPLEYFDPNHWWLRVRDDFVDLVRNWRERLDEELHGPMAANDEDEDVDDEDDADPVHGTGDAGLFGGVADQPICVSEDDEALERAIAEAEKAAKAAR
jgi:hypothetical protein